MSTTAQELLSKGAAKFGDTIQAALGGVLFIDEAYALEPKSDKIGKAIVDQILTAAENHRDDLSIILAGYKVCVCVFVLRPCVCREIFDD